MSITSDDIRDIRDPLTDIARHAMTHTSLGDDAYVTRRYATPVIGLLVCRSRAFITVAIG